MIYDPNGNDISFASGKEETLAKIQERLNERIKTALGRDPEPGELEQMGEVLIHPNGDWTFCLGTQPILKVRFEPGKVYIDDA